jgi:hypothetical protein
MQLSYRQISKAVVHGGNKFDSPTTCPDDTVSL